MVEPVNLDSDQRSALELILAGGSRRVFGGPGTGKTVLLIEALAAIAERDGRDSVRVVTPSRQSATRLRDVLSLRLGVATRGPLARSISAFAYDVVATHRGPEFPVRLISGGEQDSDIKSLLDGEIEDGTGDYWPDSLGPEVRQLREFRTQLRDLLSRSRDAGLVGRFDADEPMLAGLAERGREHGIPEWVAAATFLDGYLRVSADARVGQVDPAAIIDEAASIVESGGYVGSTTTLLVDDAQDLTVAQWRFLATWHEHRGPVLAFGDPDLATAGFRGATPTLFSGVENVDSSLWQPSAHLRSNHRQSGVLPHVLGIVASAIPGGGITQHRPYPESVEPDIARDLPGFDLFSATASSPAGEYDTVARFILTRLKDGVSPGDIAVVVRSGSLAEALVDYLTAQSIPAVTETTGMPLRDHPAVWSLLTIVGVGTGFTPFTPDIAQRLLTGPFGRLSALDYRRFRRSLRLEAIKAGDYRLADDLMMEALTVKGSFDNSVTYSAKGVARVIALVEAATANRTAQIDEILWAVWNRSGRADVWATETRGSGPLAARAHESLDAVLTLFGVAATALENAPTEAVNVFLARMLDQSVPNDTLTPRGSVGSVTVCTPAAVVGREFDTVVLAGVNEGVWPNLRVRSALVRSTLLPYANTGTNLATLDQRSGVLADEIRLFLVALSRARTAALVTAISSEDESPSGLFRIVASERTGADNLAPDEPAPGSFARPYAPHSTFASLAELVGHARHVLVDPRSPDADKHQAALALRELADRGVRGAHPREWLGMDVGTPRALGADSELRLSPSGLKSFIESPVDWFVSQVSGGASGIDAAVGTLVHKAVEVAPLGTRTEIESTITERWNELGFESSWQAVRWKNLTELMVTGLVDYIEKTTADGFVPVANEGYINVPLVDPADPSLRAVVSGSIDRVEVRDESARIIDIKTGKNVEAADNHLQLTAYQWALSKNAVTELPDGTASAGAGLLYPRVHPSDDVHFTFKFQDPLTEEQLAEFEGLLFTVARVMKSTGFAGLADPARIGREVNFDAQWVRIGEVGSDE